MTPGNLLALVEDNVHQCESVMHSNDAMFFQSSNALVNYQQDVICNLTDLPSLGYLINRNLEQEVRNAVTRRAELEIYWRIQVNAAHADVQRLQVELRALQQEKHVSVRGMYLASFHEPVFVTLEKQRQALVEKKRKLTTTHAELTREGAGKLPAYENNLYYRFLRSVFYGTPQYSRSWLFRSADAWLAKKINYQANRRNELLLLAMPRYLEEAIEELAAKDRDLNLQLSAAWQKRLATVGLDTTTSKNRLLAMQLVNAAQRKVEACIALESVTRELDGDSATIRQCLFDQLGCSPDFFLQNHRTPSHFDNNKLDRYWKRFWNLWEDRSEKATLIEIAGDAVGRARALLRVLFDLRREEGFHDCRRAGHSPDELYGRCTCAYEDDRYYEYPESLDFPQLIAGYMRQDLSLDELIIVLRNERRYFRDLPHANEHFEALAVASTEIAAS